MKIYLISHDEFEYDSTMGFVIVANNTKEVRQIAIFQHSWEGELIWKTAKVETIGNYTGKAKTPFVLMRDHRAG